ncbi:MAG: PIN domain-containing protein [Polyangiaceae bacterium]|nr:PIN domain-containing protein [Polyangiaceae bacterium]
MAETIILDAEALNALAHPHERPSLFARARAIVAVTHEKGDLVRVPAAVLAEVCRGPRHDAAINRLLNTRAILVADINRTIAQYAGQLLARLKLNSAHAVDAFVVATAAQFPAAIIATGDPADIRRLAASNRRIRVMAL